MNPQYQAYLLFSEWALLKEHIFTKRGRVCERCPSKRNLQLHYKTYERIFHEKEEDLEILCAACHCKEHGIVFKKVPMNRFPKRNKKGNLTIKGTRVPDGTFAGTKLSLMRKPKHILYLQAYVEDLENPEDWREVIQKQLNNLKNY